MRIYMPRGLLQRGVITTMKGIAASITMRLKSNFFPHLTNDYSTGNRNTLPITHLATHLFANLSPHTSPQPITSPVYQWLPYILTNQIAHQSFWIFNWLKLSLDSEDGFRTGYRKVSRQQQSFSGPQSPRWSDNQGYLLFYKSGGYQAPLLPQLPPPMHQRT